MGVSLKGLIGEYSLQGLGDKEKAASRKPFTHKQLIPSRFLLEAICPLDLETSLPKLLYFYLQPQALLTTAANANALKPTTYKPHPKSGNPNTPHPEPFLGSKYMDYLRIFKVGQLQSFVGSLCYYGPEYLGDPKKGPQF